MPPWRTVDDARAGGSPVSLTTIASASSAALRCCTSKSGGTYFWRNRPGHYRPDALPTELVPDG